VTELEASEILEELEALADEKNIKGMRRYGIRSRCRILGVPKPKLRELAKRIGVDHKLALELWDTKVHEARILASMIADPMELSEETMEKWALDFDNWDLCDQCVLNLFWKSRHAYRKAAEWPKRREEYVRRAGLALIAKLAAKDKNLKDSFFESLLPLIREASKDSRRHVYKAASWALRQIGKRSPKLNKIALKMAEEMSKSPISHERKVGCETLRELKSRKLEAKLSKAKA